MQSAYGIPEFDSLSYDSEMLITALNKLRGKNIRRVAVFNPGQGHGAIALWKLAGPENIFLIDRDLLALRYSRLNLVLNGCPPEKIHVLHQMGVSLKGEDGVDLCTGTLRDEGKEASFLMLKQATEILSRRGRIIISAGSTAITRLVNYAESQGQLRIGTRERRRGYSLLTLEKVL